MTELELKNIWNYFSILEKDLDDSSRYLEPNGQENVYSFEFSKLLILSCTEIESVFKKLSVSIENGKIEGKISAYKEAILSQYPNIGDAVVDIKRLNKSIKPFENWANERLFWWDAYQKVKHNRTSYFKEATYNNVVYSLAALYILILYCAKYYKYDPIYMMANYFDSDYENPILVCDPKKELP